MSWLLIVYGEKAELRNTIAGILKSSKITQHNITIAEKKAIHTLKTDNNITILPADKGRTTVIMDTDTYNDKMHALLDDADTYETLKKDPTEDKKKQLKALLKPLRDNNKITHKT